MREITLTQKTVSGMPKDAPQSVLLSAMRRQARGKVYYTYCQVDHKHFELTTTSREVHLMMGTLRKEGLNALCVLLEAEYGHDLHTQFLISTDQADLYVMRSEYEHAGERKALFNLSPAFGTRGGGH